MLKVANSVINASQIATPITFAGDVTLSTGNLVIGTAGKGIDFSITSHPAGMTSELLADYEEGAWTPIDSSGAGLTFTSATGTYTKIGRVVNVICSVTYPVTANVGSAIIGGLPFTTGTPEGSVFIRYTDLASLAFVFPILTTTINIYTTNGNTVTNVTLSGKRIDLVGTYFV